MRCSSKCACPLVGASFFVIGLVVALAGYFTFTGMRMKVFATVHDLMFIDHSSDLAPMGSDGEEKSQMEMLRKPMREMYKDCLKEDGNFKDDCINGADLIVAVFNITNAEGVVLHGEKPLMQEVGPIYVRHFFDKIDLDTKYFDESGIARFRQNVTCEIDEVRCQAACKELLESEVVIPNPVWASLRAMGAEPVMAVGLVFGGIAMTTPTEQLPFIPSVLFGLDAGAESEAFLNTFLLQTDPVSLQASVGSFLFTAMQAAQALANGDETQLCFVGNVPLAAPKCASVMDKVMGMVPNTWNATMAALAPMYRVGAAAPVFIRATVAQALGLGGANFSDPLTKSPGLSYMLLADFVDPVGAVREVQMASKFGSQGTSFYVKQNGVAADCRFDSDCVLLDPFNVGSCNASEICTPQELRGYSGSGLPGRVWGEPQGFTDFGVGREVNIIAPNGLISTMACHGEKEHVVSHDGSEHILKYTSWTMAGFSRRLENCNGTGPGSPGIDCHSPTSTVNMGPLTMGMPLYISTPFFDSTILSGLDKMNAGQVSAPYEPLDRVKIDRCTGNQWCEEKGSSKYTSFLKIEPESGFVFDGWAAAQANLRIGFGPAPSMLHPNAQDALIPIYWFSEGLTLPAKMQAGLAKVQGAPDMLSFMANLCLVFGAALAMVGMCCMAFGFHQRRKGPALPGPSSAQNNLEEGSSQKASVDQAYPNILATSANQGDDQVKI